MDVPKLTRHLFAVAAAAVKPATLLPESRLADRVEGDVGGDRGFGLLPAGDDPLSDRLFNEREDAFGLVRFAIPWPRRDQEEMNMLRHHDPPKSRKPHRSRAAPKRSAKARAILGVRQERLAPLARECQKPNLAVGRRANHPLAECGVDVRGSRERRMHRESVPGRLTRTPIHRSSEDR
jgi:hypothetical protein